MNVKKLLIAAVVVGIVMNVFDWVVQGMILQKAYYSTLTTLFRPAEELPMLWLIIGDFVAALVLVYVYDRAYSSFGGGPKGGATYGLYAGILVNFPTWIFAHLLFVGFPYSLSWVWTVVGVVWFVVGGAVAGALYKK
jgi:hypothetical protein